MSSIEIKIPVTPPGPIGTTKGGHIYVEAPDQSSLPTARMDGVTLLDGSSVLQDDWAPLDMGKIPYVAAEQPWSFLLPAGTLSNRVSNDLRIYVSPYSDDIDTPLVRYGQPGATPSVVVTVAAEAVKKPNSGSNITQFLVTGLSAAVSPVVTIAGKLRRPIGVTVDLTGLPTALPEGWAYQLVGYQDGDINTDPVLESGIFDEHTDGLAAAGPDGITTPHTFGPEEPTSITNITIYAVAGLITRRVPGGGSSRIASFVANNIVPGITASCQITIGTTSGVYDLRAAMLASTSAEFHIDPSTGLFAMNAVDFTKATNFSAQFAISGAQMHVVSLAADVLVSGIFQVGGGGSKVSILRNFDTSNNLIGWVGDDSAVSGFVGAWFKRLLIGGTSPATAKIVADASGNVAISGTLISGNIAGNAANITGVLSASQIAAGTISVALTLTAAAIVGGSITGASFSVTSGTGVITEITPVSGGMVIRVSGGDLTLYDQSGMAIVHSGATTSLSPFALLIANNQVVGSRKTGPGAPGTFTTLFDAQTWCSQLYFALAVSGGSGHGLIT